jgi:hypothetical protein
LSREDTVSVRVSASQAALALSDEYVARGAFYELFHQARQRWGPGVKLEYGYVMEWAPGEEGSGRPTGITFMATRVREGT